jgi:hypothetical protein
MRSIAAVISVVPLVDRLPVLAHRDILQRELSRLQCIAEVEAQPSIAQGDAFDPGCVKTQKSKRYEE